MKSISEFTPIIVKVAEQVRWSGFSQATIEAYYEALQAFPVEAVKAAAALISIGAGRKFAPTAGEWVEEARAQFEAEARQRLAAPRDPWKYDCEECNDTGWVVGLECAGGDSSSCGRNKPHAAHSFTRSCGCRATNPTYQRHHTFNKAGKQTVTI
jgi:hypothetical protein